MPGGKDRSDQMPPLRGHPRAPATEPPPGGSRRQGCIDPTIAPEGRSPHRRGLHQPPAGPGQLPPLHEQAKQPSPSQTAITKPSSRCHTQTSSPRTGRETAMEVASRITRLREGHWPEMVEHELNMRKHHPAIGLKLPLWHRHKKVPHKQSQGSAWLRTSSICHLAII